MCLQVMIEAVENHMPQVIVIDEIGTELEANAAGTIAQRGVQLVGTAHGMTVENLIKNPSLQMLAGGVQVWFFFFCITFRIGSKKRFIC
jgi:stage III sporulation protein SpoIIIAA